MNKSKTFSQKRQMASSMAGEGKHQVGWSLVKKCSEYAKASRKAKRANLKGSHWENMRKLKPKINDDS